MCFVCMYDRRLYSDQRSIIRMSTRSLGTWMLHVCSQSGGKYDLNITHVFTKWRQMLSVLIYQSVKQLIWVDWLHGFAEIQEFTQNSLDCCYRYKSCVMWWHIPAPDLTPRLSQTRLYFYCLISFKTTFSQHH